MNGTTTDGRYTVSATEQSGAFAGERVGRVWVRNNLAQGASSWKFYGLQDAAKAAQLEQAASTLTAEEFDEALADAL